MNNIAIRCRSISKSYGEGENRIHVLQDINLEIYAGKLTLLVGPSGSGKTTLLSIIATILTPDTGQLWLLEQEIATLSNDQKALLRRNKLGIVFQSFFLIPTLTVLENVTLPLLVAGQRQTLAEAKAREILSWLKLDSRANSSPYLLSKGQQQRIAIARAMVNDSQIFICDEPTSALDHESGHQIMTLLHQLAEQWGKAVVVVTHDPRLFPFADRIVGITDGQLTEGSYV
jgi:putative ABC transport system ATP-binding protein